MEKHEVVIVGAGPAGLTAAKVLAEAGKDVVVLDKLSKDKIGDKVCFGGIFPNAMDLVPKSLFKGKSSEVLIHTPKEEFLITLDTRPYCNLVSRHELGQYQLKEAKKEGANIEGNSKVTAINLKENSITASDGMTLGYKYLIGADGATSIVRKSLGLHHEFLSCFQFVFSQKKENHPLTDMYVNWDLFKTGVIYYAPMYREDMGMVSVIGGETILPKAPIKTHEMVKNVKDWFTSQDFPMEKAKFESGPVNIKYNGVQFGNVFLIGDASGISADLFAEGISSAIRSADLVSKLIIGKKNEAKRELEELLHSKKKHTIILSALNNGVKALDLIPYKTRDKIANMSIEVGAKVGKRVMLFDTLKNFILDFVLAP